MEAGPAAYGEAEREWLAALGEWRATIDATLWEFTVASTDDQLLLLLQRGDEAAQRFVGSLLEGLGDCPESFRTHVGPSPTVRLEAGAEAVLTACEYLERGAGETLADLGRADGDPFRDSVFWIGDGRERLWTSNRQVLLRADGRRLIARGAPGESNVDVGLSEAANEVVDLLSIQLQVRCWSQEDWPDIVEELSAFTGGAVQLETMAWASHSIGVHVSPTACATLNELEDGAATVDEESATALVAFARELGDFYGVREDAVAECWGMQFADDVAAALRVQPSDGRALARLYWEQVFPRLPTERRAPECRPGGQLDFDPTQPAWP